MVLQIPFGIKKRLVDDREAIQNGRSLIPLPKPPSTTVAEIIRQYLLGVGEATAQRLGHDVPSLRTAATGIQGLFDVALGRMLLYKPERLQYARILQRLGRQDARPSDVFGAEHLARLIVTLPQLLAGTAEAMDQRAVDRIQCSATELLHFVEENARSLWSSQYIERQGDYDAEYDDADGGGGAGGAGADDS
jgi:mortality factor 4-like protein 1